MLPDELKFPQLQAAVTKMLDDPQPMFDLYEYGLYNGTSLSKTIRLLEAYEIPYRKVFGIDSFQGLTTEDQSVELFSKFKAGEYKTKLTPKEVYNKIYLNYKLCIIDKWFKDLNKQDVANYDMKPAKFIHIDADLYISAKQALEFMFENKLIVKHTLISYDEYRSTNSLAGEEKAHLEMMYKYNCECEEVWRFVYRDKQTHQKITQKLFEVISV